MRAASDRSNPLQAHPDAGATLSKAVRNAASLLEIRQNALARILGVSPATASRLCAGSYQLSAERGKEWELGILLVRLFRSLDALLGHDADARNRHEPARGVILTSEMPDLPVQLFLFSAGLFMDGQKRLDHGSKLMPVDAQRHDLLPKLRTD